MITIVYDSRSLPYSLKPVSCKAMQMSPAKSAVRHVDLLIHKFIRNE